MIPLADLKRDYQAIKPQVDAAIADVLSRGWFILGEKVKQFEEAFSRYCGARYAVGVGSGTEALHLALVACGIGIGDEIITVANTCVPTVSAVSFAGATPVFVDIDSLTYTMDPALIENRITERTKAILPVHLYGQCADMDPILKIAQRYGLRVIEDCAQAHGAEYKGRKAGTMGNVGCFSFYPTKNLGAFGDAGMIITNHYDIAEKLRLLRNYGQKGQYDCSVKGYNSRLDELQAAILLAKLPYLDDWNLRRRNIAQVYTEALHDTDVICPLEAPERKHVYHLYVIQVQNRDQLQAVFREHDIKATVHYPIPLYKQHAYSGLGYPPGALPVTESIAGRIISLPIHPWLEDDEASQIIRTVTEASGKGSVN